MLSAYLQISRPDHWFKNIFMVPGIALGLLIGGVELDPGVVADIILAVIASCLGASANYTINEWLDAEFDRFHPTKRNRPSARGLVSARGVYLQWTLLAGATLVIGYFINTAFLLFASIFLLMGVIYNVSPFRTKDRIHLDTLTESINNPLRFMLGWCAVNTSQLPPSSIILAYWMGGAYLMATKRYAEYRFIGDPESAALYRRSFRYYTEESLLLSAFFYAITAAFFTGIFLIKHRIEYIVMVPILAFLFSWYLKIGMSENSVTQNPEKLYQDKGLMYLLLVLVVMTAILTFLDIPWLEILVTTHTKANGDG